jgi:O-antigen chain-terminating methyltransferase
MEATREHTEAAIAAARAHTEMAIAAAQTAVVAAAREHAESAAEASASTARAAAQSHAEAMNVRTREELLAAIAGVRRELRTQQRVAKATHVPQLAGASFDRAEQPAFDPTFYVALEDRFRGDFAEIAERQRQYVDIVADLVDDEHPLLDLGCGRGEWLEILSENGLRAIGVDNNRAFVEENNEAGREVVDADLIGYLEAAGDDSVGAITLFQVVEHLEIAVLLRLMDEAIRVLRPGGVLVAETPNALNLQVGASTFWIDPTHIRPLHPEFLQFCAVHSGFSKVDGLFVNELDPGYRSIRDASVRRLAERLDGPGDYSLLAWK